MVKLEINAGESSGLAWDGEFDQGIPAEIQRSEICELAGKSEIRKRVPLQPQKGEVASRLQALDAFYIPAGRIQIGESEEVRLG